MREKSAFTRTQPIKGPAKDFGSLMCHCRTNTFFTLGQFDKFREKVILPNVPIVYLDLQETVFEDAVITVCVLILGKGKQESSLLT